jgi:hypothetical protein
VRPIRGARARCPQRRAGSSVGGTGAARCGGGIDFRDGRSALDELAAALGWSLNQVAVASIVTASSRLSVDRGAPRHATAGDSPLISKAGSLLQMSYILYIGNRGDGPG